MSFAFINLEPVQRSDWGWVWYEKI